MAVFKQIGGGNHTVEPFEVNYSQSFAWISGSTSLSGFSINLVDEPPTNYPISTTQSLGGVTDGGFNSYPMFNSIENYFYVGEASASSNNIYGFYPSSSMFVWNIGSKYTGNGIKPDTFKIELDGIATNIQDDGNGKLKLNKTGSVVGNVFYKHGIAAVERNMTASANLISKDGISIIGSKTATTSFQSMIDIYEHTVNCRIDPSEFNVTFNPTSFETTPSGSGWSGTGSFNADIISGSVLPFITTLGLYNNHNELVAVGKLSKPITRMRYTDQTFVVRFDE